MQISLRNAYEARILVCLSFSSQFDVLPSAGGVSAAVTSPAKLLCKLPEEPTPAWQALVGLSPIRSADREVTKRVSDSIGQLADAIYN